VESGCMVHKKENEKAMHRKTSTDIDESMLENTKSRKDGKDEWQNTATNPALGIGIMVPKLVELLW